MFADVCRVFYYAEGADYNFDPEFARESVAASAPAQDKL
jgi:hypothetical protein